MTTGYLYVPNEGDNTVSSNDAVVATIPVGGDTVAVSPNGAFALSQTRAASYPLSVPPWADEPRLSPPLLGSSGAFRFVLS